MFIQDISNLFYIFSQFIKLNLYFKSFFLEL